MAARPLPRFACRLNSMGAQPDRMGWQHKPTTVDLIARLGTVEGITAVELNYPQHLDGHDPEALADAAHQAGLPITSVNLRFPDDPFLEGNLTNPKPEIRDAAVELVVNAAATARRFGAPAVTMWLDKDGWDYPFQVDHAAVWEYLLDGLGRIVRAAPDMRFSIEYKPNEPRAFSTLGNFGLTMHAIRSVGAANLGVRLDFCHVLMARESPGQVAALAQRDDKLFGIDFNDGYGLADDGLMIGSVNATATLEFVWYLYRSNFDGVVYFDTFPIREDPVAEAAENVRRFTVLWHTVADLEANDLSALLTEQATMQTQRLLFDAIWQRP